METPERVAAVWFVENLADINRRLARWSRRFGRFADECFAEARALLWVDAVRKAKVGALAGIRIGLMVGWAQAGVLHGRSIRQTSKSQAADRRHEGMDPEELDRVSRSRYPNPAEAFRRREDWSVLMGRLNERERRVVRLIRDGWRTSEIAAELLVTPGRVSQHKTRIAAVMAEMGYGQG